MFYFIFVISHFLQPARAGKIGIYYDFIDENVLSGNGIVVKKVVPNSPAEHAGIEKGDWILLVNGKSVFEDRQNRTTNRILTEKDDFLTLCVKKTKNAPLYIEDMREIQKQCQNIQIVRSNTRQPSISIVDQAYKKRTDSETVFLSFFHEQDPVGQQQIIAYFYSKYPNLLSLKIEDPIYLLQQVRFFQKNESWDKAQTVLDRYEDLFGWKEEDIYPSKVGFLIKIDVLVHNGKPKKEVIDFIINHKYIYHTPNIWQRYGISYPISQKIEVQLPSVEDFYVKLSNGDKWKLSDQHGKTTVLLFWATWCGPCRAELREVQKLAKRNPDISFLAVSVDQQKSSSYVFATANKWGLSIPIAHGPKLGQMFRASSLPTTHVFDKEGRWKESNVGYSPRFLSKIVKEQHVDAHHSIGDIIPFEQLNAQTNYHFYPRSDIEDIFVFDSQMWFIDGSQNIQKLDSKELHSNNFMPISSIQSLPNSNYQIALNKSISCVGKEHTIHCTGEKTWFQNTDEEVRNLYFEEDILCVESASKVLMYNHLGHFVGSKYPHPFQIDLTKGSTVQSSYETTLETFDWNEDHIPDRVMLFSGLGLLFIESIRP